MGLIQGKITMANGAEIPFELYPDEAPITVANFVKLIKEGYYNGGFPPRHSAFRFPGRLPSTAPARAIWATRFPAKQKTIRTSISRARCRWLTAARIPAAASSSICHDPQPHLDGVHTVFGQVTDNLGAVRAMRNGDVMTKVEITEE